jgi:hypothetical protein
MAWALGCLLLFPSETGAQTAVVDDFELFVPPAEGRGLAADRWTVVYRQGTTAAGTVWEADALLTGGASRALRISGRGSSYNVARSLSFRNIGSYPYLSWKWKVVAAPDGADIRDAARDDSAAQLYVSFDLKGSFWGYPLVLSLGYFYATAADGAGPYLWDGYGSFVKFVPLRSTAVAGTGRWLAEMRNVAADYAQAVRDFLAHPEPAVRRRFRKALERASPAYRDTGLVPDLDLHSLSLWVDSNDTRSQAESLYDDIVFSAATTESGP